MRIFKLISLTSRLELRNNFVKIHPQARNRESRFKRTLKYNSNVICKFIIEQNINLRIVQGYNAEEGGTD